MHFMSAKGIWAFRIIWTIIALGIVIALGRALPLGAAGATPVFINEIHYDNTGTDANEFIEIAGPAGTDLTGWSLVLYNGSGGAPYTTTNLSGLLPDQGNGYGTLALSYPVNGIQNGAPDGVALVNNTGTAVQFLSYEGTFTAVGGPANGQTSTDLGVGETGSEALGLSLQLGGSGVFYEDFTWRAPAAHTSGTINNNQTFGAGNVPPTAGVTPPDGATGVEPSANIVVQFSEPVQLQPGWFSFACATSGTPAVSESLDNAANRVLLDPQNDLAAGEQCTLSLNSSLITDLEGAPLTGATSFSFTVSAFSVCFDPATPIHTIQGSGETSPLAGRVVVIEGVVVGDYQDAFSGFFVQEEDAEADSEPATSEGIFVFDDNAGIVVNPGDIVRVEGKAVEFSGMTELSPVTRILVCGTGGSVTPTQAGLPQPTPGAFEAFEGMLVTFDQELTVSENFNLGRFGEIVLSSGGRLYQPTHLVAPGAPAQALAAANALNKIFLDDANNRQNPDPIRYLPALGAGRTGSTISGLTGILEYRFNVYRIQPVPGYEPVFVDANPRPQAAPAPSGFVKVAAANVLNYFTTLDAIPTDDNADNPSDNVCGPLANQECRGADLYPNVDELARQRDKIAAALAGLDADVVGLLEIENHAQDAAVRDLVNTLNSRAGAAVYAAIETGPIGGDAIKVALIYKPGVVSPVGSYKVLDSSVDPAFIDTKNRPVLAQTFAENSTGERFTVAVAHLKSKGSDCKDVNDPDSGDGQGNCNGTRTAAAQALATWLGGDPTGSGDGDFLIVGDLNAYAKEDPITTLQNAGYTNLIDAFNGSSAYSYVFDAQSGYLDHALGSASLSGQVTGAAEWHINADEPRIVDYNVEFKSPGQVTGLYSPDKYRASDHDPLLVGLCLNQIAPTVSVTPATLWPANHQMVEVKATLSNLTGPATLVSVTSSEPDNGVDDGDTTGDIVIVDQTTVHLRAERAGSGPGRIYTLTYSVTDRCGVTRQLTATVTVPISQGKTGGKVQAAEGTPQYRVYLPGLLR